MARLIRGVVALVVAGSAGYLVGASEVARALTEQAARAIQIAGLAAGAARPTESTQTAPSELDAVPRAGAIAATMRAPLPSPPAAAARSEPVATPSLVAVVQLPAAPVVRAVGGSRLQEGQVWLARDEEARRSGWVTTRSSDDETRRRLARSIQGELKRVGCYKGEVDGDWSAETRRAMKAFNDRVNASLPIEQPDFILLTLLQGHAAQACGPACPAGQVPTARGTCEPRSIIAARPAPVAEPERTTEAPASRPSAAVSRGPQATPATAPMTPRRAGKPPPRRPLPSAPRPSAPVPRPTAPA